VIVFLLLSARELAESQVFKNLKEPTSKADDQEKQLASATPADATAPVRPIISSQLSAEHTVSPPPDTASLSGSGLPFPIMQDRPGGSSHSSAILTSVVPVGRSIPANSAGRSSSPTMSSTSGTAPNALTAPASAPKPNHVSSRAQRRNRHRFSPCGDFDPTLIGIIHFEVFVFLYFIVSNEVYLARNPSDGFDKLWGFGQVFALVATFPTIVSVWNAFREHGFKKESKGTERRKGITDMRRNSSRRPIEEKDTGRHSKTGRKSSP